MFLHSLEAHVIDLVEIIDIVVVIRLVAVDFIPRKSIARDTGYSKDKRCLGDRDVKEQTRAGEPRFGLLQLRNIERADLKPSRFEPRARAWK